MTDIELRKEFAMIHGKLYGIMSGTALLIDKNTALDFTQAMEKMIEDGNTWAQMLINSIDAGGTPHAPNE